MHGKARATHDDDTLLFRATVHASALEALGVAAETLEGRRLFSTVTLGDDGVLAIDADGDVLMRASVSYDAATNTIHTSVLGRPDQSFNADLVEELRIIGSGGDDVITLARNVTVPAEIHGGAGDDLITGGGGDDTIDAGDGDDTVRAGRGDDTVNGGDGADLVYGDAGDDEVFGDDGADELRGGRGSDTLWGGSGNDLLVGGFETDTLHGEDGNDSLWGKAGEDTLVGGNGLDELVGGNGTDEMYSSLTSLPPVYG